MTQAPDSRQGDIRPIPDPTVLTTEASARMEKMLRELILSEIAHLDALFSERFVRIEIRFNMLDARTAEQKQDTTNALNAALAAQKEAGAAQTNFFRESIAKLETAALERIKALETLLATSNRASDDKITDIKDRLIAIEAIKLGATEQVATTRAGSVDMRGNLSAVMGVIAGLVGVISIIITIIVVTTR